MTKRGSRIYRQMQPLRLSRPKPLTEARHTLLPIAVLVFIFLGIAVQNDVSVRWAGAVGTLSTAAVTTISTETEVVVAGALTGGHVPAALRAVTSEKDHVEAEEVGFQEFATEVQSLSLARQSVMGTNVQSVNTAPGNRVLERVREAYRETVMSTPDFDNEYAESFEEHVTAEFGEDVASFLIGGRHLNEPVKRLLVQQARQSAQQRSHLREGLTVEERSLEDAASSIESVQEFLAEVGQTKLYQLSLPKLISLDSELRKQRDHCVQILETRQQEIHTVNRRMNGETNTLTQEYIYRDLPVNFPVLSTTLDYINSIDDTRSSLIRSVSQPR